MPDEPHDHEDCTTRHDDPVDPASRDREPVGPQSDGPVFRLIDKAIENKNGEHKRALTLFAGMAATFVLATGLLWAIFLGTLALFAVTIGPATISIGGGTSGALALTGIIASWRTRKKRQKVAEMRQKIDEDLASRAGTPTLRVQSERQRPRDEQGGG